MKKLLFLSVVALAACSKSGGGGAGGSSCAAAIDNALNSMAADNSGPMAEMKGKLREVYLKHCEADKWPAATIDCFSKAKAQPDIRHCRQTLPEDQAKAVQQEVMQMMAGAGGMQGMHGGGMHGGGDMQGGSMQGGATPPTTNAGSPPPAGAGSQDTAPNGNGGTPITNGSGSAK
ncbi:MAG TPA: hypothetical protein VGM39_25920 [Kofleriaceae bacterium]|jgi:hypothetical protein